VPYAEWAVRSRASLAERSERRRILPPTERPTPPEDASSEVAGRAFIRAASALECDMRCQAGFVGLTPGAVAPSMPMEPTEWGRERGGSEVKEEYEECGRVGVVVRCC